MIIPITAQKSLSYLSKLSLKELIEGGPKQLRLWLIKRRGKEVVRLCKYPLEGGFLTLVKINFSASATFVMRKPSYVENYVGVPNLTIKTMELLTLQRLQIRDIYFGVVLLFMILDHGTRN